MRVEFVPGNSLWWGLSLKGADVNSLGRALADLADGRDYYCGTVGVF